jgi:SAM-dependent methyltransferase
MLSRLRSFWWPDNSYSPAYWRVLKRTRQYYNRQARVHGNSLAALGWQTAAGQAARFSQFLQAFPAQSIVDFGCGRGDFYGFLCDQGWTGTYTGLDISPEMIRFAQQRYPAATFILGSLADIPQADMVVASGVFSLRIPDPLYHLTAQVGAMVARANQCVLFNALSQSCESQVPGLQYYNPTHVHRLCRQWDPQATLIRDYWLDDFTIWIKNNMR